MNTPQKPALLVTAAVLLLAVALLAPGTAMSAEPPSEDAATLQFSFGPSTKTVNLSRAAPGQILIYSIHVVSQAPGPAPGTVTDAIPEVVDYLPGTAWASQGEVWVEEGVLHWQGIVPPLGEVMISFHATPNFLAPAGQPIANQAYIQDLLTGLGEWRQVTTYADTNFTGFDNTGKIALDGGWGEGGACGPWECDWYECAAPCEDGL